MTGSVCPAEFHIASEWPSTAAGHLAVIACFSVFNGNSFDYFTKTVNATRACFENGTWSSFANYTDCIESRQADEYDESDQFAQILNVSSTALHYMGYSLSLAACLLAVLIYARFRTLRRLRNVIHLNLIITYILSATSYIILTVPSQVKLAENPDDALNSTFIRTAVIAFTYSQLTTFFWAFCEGIYMTCILFRPHRLEQLRFLPFGVGGWVVPAFIVTSWAAVKFTYENNVNWLTSITYCNIVFILPILLVLAINTVLMFIALYTIIHKHSTGQRTSSTLGRGVRSFLILMPLLGLTYVMGIVQPNDNGVVHTVLQLVSSVLLPIQGLFVSVMYCFCNRQVRGLINSHCFHKLTSRFGGVFKDQSPNLIVIPGSLIDKENSSMRCAQYDLRTFKGNTNELQYILKARKSLARNNLSINTESIRLSRMSSKSKFPVVVV